MISAQANGYAGTVSVSTDYGSTWTQKLASDPNGSTWEDVKVSDDGSKIILAYTSGLAISSDRGDNWTYITDKKGPVALSSDGSVILASTLASDWKTYLSTRRSTTTVGASYAAIGEEGSSIDLVYLGNDSWAVTNSAGGVTYY
jgi:photosystem II stability/assembly factor-like uncharacterized protein